METIIEVKNLIKRYKKSDKNAVDDISFDVHKGEFFAFLGPNGAGKTTAISILTAMLNLTSGKVSVAGFDVTKDSHKVRQEIGVIFQEQSLDKNLTAEENIRFHASLYGLFPFRPFYSLMSEDYKERVNELAKLVGIENDLFKTIKTYSGGMRRKLEIIRSLMHKPKILFLDEPTTGLDPLSRKNVWEYILKVRKEDETTIFLTTHYLEEAAYADRICIMNNGKIVSIGTPNEIRKDIIDSFLEVNSLDTRKLGFELIDHNFNFSGSGPFQIELNNESRSLQEIIHLIKTPLSDLKVHEPTLEEAYIEIINKTSLNKNEEALP